MMVWKKACQIIEVFRRKSKELVSLNSEDERTLFRKYLRESNCYLEFGSGGSTFEACKIISPKKGKIYSIEGSEEWFASMLKYKIIKENIDNGFLDLMYMCIGKTKEFSYPCEEDKRELYPNYYSILQTEIIKNIDTLLVDGRFRVACTLNTIKNCQPNITILIHDFPEREEYHVLLKYLDTIERSGTLFVFKLKTLIDNESLDADIEKYRYDVR